MKKNQQKDGMNDFLCRGNTHKRTNLNLSWSAVSLLFLFLLLILSNPILYHPSLLSVLSIFAVTTHPNTIPAYTKGYDKTPSLGSMMQTRKRRE